MKVRKNWLLRGLPSLKPSRTSLCSILSSVGIIAQLDWTFSILSSWWNILCALSTLLLSDWTALKVRVQVLSTVVLSHPYKLLTSLLLKRNTLLGRIYWVHVKALLLRSSSTIDHHAILSSILNRTDPPQIQRSSRAKVQVGECGKSRCSM